MIDYTLRFANEEESISVLYGDVVDGVFTSKYPAHAIDVIGLIYKPDGTFTDGEPNVKAITGWHVNVRGSEDDVLAQYHVTVATPYRVWA